MGKSRYDQYDPAALAVLNAARSYAVEAGRGECQPVDLIAAMLGDARPRKALGTADGAGIKLHLSPELRGILDRAEQRRSVAVRELDLLRATFQVSRKELVEYLAYPQQPPTGVSGPAPATERLEDVLKRSVIGQDNAILAVAETLRVRSMHLDSQVGRPLATFLFSGSTGVGKTELAIEVASALTKRPDRLLRLDCSEYSEAHQVARLIGAPPSYVGYGDPSLIEEFLKGGPSGVILLDEFEKAHPAMHLLFLQAFDVGRITTSAGKTLDLSGMVFVATANITPRTSRDPIGFGDRKAGGLNEVQPLDEFKAFFSLELLNRFDEIIVFNSLGPDELRMIFRNLLLARANDQLLSRHGVRMDLSERAEALVLEQGTSAEFGARHLRRTFTRLVLRPLAHFLSSQSSPPAASLLVDAAGGEVKIVGSVTESSLYTRPT